MKLEKRSDGGPAEPVEGNEDKRKKPVVIYIMILFIAAFLLMAWSFASHQRSNTEALGRLQSSVTVMREVQDLQDQVISLQKELADAFEEAAGAPKEVDYAAEAQQSLASKLGRGVRIVKGKKKGRIELEYYGLDDLNDLLEALALLKTTRKGPEA